MIRVSGLPTIVDLELEERVRREGSESCELREMADLLSGKELGFWILGWADDHPSR